MHILLLIRFYRFSRSMSIVSPPDRHCDAAGWLICFTDDFLFFF